MKIQGASPSILVALDYHDAKPALQLVDQLDPALCGLKVGKELFTSTGPSIVRDLVNRKFAVFLDLKFHDIPHTVGAAVLAAADLGVWMVNVHASGGRAMLEAARKSLEQFHNERPLITAVTVLTSFSDDDLREIGVSHSVFEQVSRLAILTEQCGLDGVVCSAMEAARLRKERRQGFILVTPGIRMPEGNTDDQQRVVTPSQAIANGADYLVVGRPVTRSPNPLVTLQKIIDEISYKNS